MSRRSLAAFVSQSFHAPRLRGGGRNVALVALVAALIVTVQAGIQLVGHPSSVAAGAAKAPTVQYVSANGLANPGFTSSATAACPTGTYLISGTHVAATGVKLDAEGASNNAWVVTAEGNGARPVFYSAVATCLSMAAYPAIQTLQSTFTGTTVMTLYNGNLPEPLQDTESGSAAGTLSGSPGFPWSVPGGIGSVTGTLNLPLNGINYSYNFVATGSAYGEYTPATGSFVENLTLHASVNLVGYDLGSLTLPLTLTTGISMVGSISRTGSPMDASGHITVVGVGTLSGTGLVGDVFGGSIVAVTLTGSTTGFPTN